jgi:protein O-mannosyl-transferase
MTPPPALERDRRARVGLALALLAAASLVAAVHCPVLGAQAHALDDNLFVTSNALVTHPGWRSAGRFFGEVLSPSSVGGYYLPLTMTSLMLDYAGGGRPTDYTTFHRTSLLLHVLNVVLLGLILDALFGSALPAALAALLFGLHPLTVEPVAWVSERKTLLATFFAFASVLCYTRHARGGRGWLSASALCYLLALLSKPAVTALPLMLLVLDAWPLRRLGRAALIEKWPFFLLSLASVAVTIVSQARTAPIAPLPGAGPVRPILQVCYLLVFYMRKIVWPLDLAPLYQPPASFSLADPLILASVVITGALFVGVVLAGRRAPAVPVSALLFLLALSPTFLILKWSRVIAYDRYLYFPGLGLAVLAGAALVRAWNGAGHRRAWRVVPVVLVLVVAAALAAGTRSTLAHWRDSVALWSRVVEISPREVDPHIHLGVALEERGELDAAAAQYQGILSQLPDHGPALIDLGMLEMQRGRFDAAVPLFRHVCRLAPRDPNFAYQLGMAEKGAGHPDLAEAEFRRVLELRPGDVPARVQLGTVLVMNGRREQGIEVVRAALAMAPSDPNAHFGLAMIQLRVYGPSPEALDHLELAVRLAPEWTLPANTLAWIRATSPDSAYRNGEAALELAARVNELAARRDPNALDTYGAALATLGRFDEAVKNAEAAADLALRSGDRALADSARARGELYRRRVAYIDRSLAPATPPPSPPAPSRARPATGSR